jgi:BlaI family penicillinase repressor
MARKKSRYLTDTELKLMEVLWEKGTATVSDVVETLSKTAKSNPPAYSTVLTILRILENKGHIKHTKEGRAFVYRPVIPREKAQETAITHLLRRFFENSPELLVLNLLERGKISAEKLQQLRKQIEEKE